MDGISGTTSTAQAHISVRVEPRIVVAAKVTTNDPAIEVIKTSTLANGVQVIVYVPSTK